MKLNKRLSALEMNISLSNEYLTELSRRYVAQTEENRKMYDRILKAAEEVANATSKEATSQLKEQVGFRAPYKNFKN